MNLAPHRRLWQRFRDEQNRERLPNFALGKNKIRAIKNGLKGGLIGSLKLSHEHLQANFFKDKSYSLNATSYIVSTLLSRMSNLNGSLHTLNCISTVISSMVKGSSKIQFNIFKQGKKLGIRKESADAPICSRNQDVQKGKTERERGKLYTLTNLSNVGATKDMEESKKK